MKQETEDTPVPEDHWALLDEINSVDNWLKLTNLTLDREVRTLQRRTIRAALRLVR
jgi:hypothetical protein